MSRPPRYPALRAAAATILDRLRELDAGDPARPVAVGVTGPVASGKSTLARELADGFRDGRRDPDLAAAVLSTDRYLPDYDTLEPGEEDRPERSDLARLAADVDALLTAEPRAVPVWSFHAHKRTGEETLGPIAADGLLVVEGLHALHAAVRPRLDLAVYVEAPPGQRLARWERLAEEGERGWGLAETQAFFHGTAEPTYFAVAEGYRAAADLVITNEG